MVVCNSIYMYIQFAIKLYHYRDTISYMLRIPYFLIMLLDVHVCDKLLNHFTYTSMDAYIYLFYLFLFDDSLLSV